MKEVIQELQTPELQAPSHQATHLVPSPSVQGHSHLNSNAHADARTRLEAADNASQPSAAASTIGVQPTLGSCRTYPDFITDRRVWNHHDPLIPSYPHFSVLSASQHYHTKEPCSIFASLAAKSMSEAEELEAVQSVRGSAAKPNRGLFIHQHRQPSSADYSS